MERDIIFIPAIEYYHLAHFCPSLKGGFIYSNSFGMAAIRKRLKVNWVGSKIAAQYHIKYSPEKNGLLLKKK